MSEEEIPEEELRRGEKYKLAREIAKKVLNKELITEEEKAILDPVHSLVAMSLAAEGCRGVAGVTEVHWPRWNPETKTWGEPEPRRITLFNLCVARNLQAIDYELRRASVKRE